MAYKLGWEKFYFEKNIDELESLFRADAPSICAFDTETFGLNIQKDAPFLFILSWKVPSKDIGKVAVIGWTPEIGKRLIELMLSCVYIVGHNTTYDLHMMRNGGAEFPLERLSQNAALTDTMVLARLLNPVDYTKAEASLALKYLACKFIDSSANKTEMDVKRIINSIKSSRRAILNERLESLPGKWTCTKIKAFLKKDANMPYDLPIDIYNVYADWLQSPGEGNYYDAFLKNEVSMVNYAFNDGIYTLELFLLFFAQIELEGEGLCNLFNQENKLIGIYYEQEKHGFNIDIPYLTDSMYRVWQYTNSLKNELATLLGEKISINQHKVLRDKLRYDFKVPIHYFEVVDTKDADASTLKLSKDILLKIKTLGGPLERICTIIIILRTTTKWLSTYTKGILLEIMENTDSKYHPTSWQAGTVTGRISGTMQQMPRDALYNEQGEELFHPRKIIIPSGNGYNTLVLQDFDQMELRVQAHYTIMAGLPDKNLLSLFIPYDKLNVETGKLYNVNSPEDRLDSTKKQPTGESIWVDPTDWSKSWVPADPHGMHVTTAFGYTPEHPDWKALRSAGKTINFAINYGSGLKSLLQNESLESFSSETITKLFNAYHTNFVGVGNYKKWVNAHIARESKMSNVYGRIYKVREPHRYAYKVGNYLVQGSCADLLKRALIMIDEFIKKNKLKSRVLYTVHDELIWELYKGEEYVIREIEKLLNTAGSWSVVPLTCGTDVSTTNWAEKKPYEGGE